MSKTFHGKSDFVVFLIKSKCQKSVNANYLRFRSLFRWYRLFSQRASKVKNCTYFTLHKRTSSSPRHASRVINLIVIEFLNMKSCCWLCKFSNYVLISNREPFKKLDAKIGHIWPLNFDLSMTSDWPKFDSSWAASSKYFYLDWQDYTRNTNSCGAFIFKV